MQRQRALDGDMLNLVAIETMLCRGVLLFHKIVSRLSTRENRLETLGDAAWLGFNHSAGTVNKLCISLSKTKSENRYGVDDGWEPGVLN